MHSIHGKYIAIELMMFLVQIMWKFSDISLLLLLKLHSICICENIQTKVSNIYFYFIETKVWVFQ